MTVTPMLNICFTTGNLTVRLSVCVWGHDNSETQKFEGVIFFKWHLYQNLDRIRQPKVCLSVYLSMCVFVNMITP